MWVLLVAMGLEEAYEVEEWACTQVGEVLLGLGCTTLWFQPQPEPEDRHMQSGNHNHSHTVGSWLTAVGNTISQVSINTPNRAH